MSKRISVLMMLACLPFAAGAAEPALAETSATETTAAAATTPASADVAKKPGPCEKVTGSRVRPNARDCSTTKPFRTYTAEDLQRTGEMNMSDALRKLDPIFR